MNPLTLAEKAPAGKSFFIWKIKDVSGGNVEAIAAEACRLKLSRASVKIANGASRYNLRLGLFDDYIPALQAALAAVGVKLTGWVYAYGNDPRGEARIAIERAKKFGLDCLEIDAEAEYKQAGKAAAARVYMAELRAGLPGVSLGLCSYRYPSLHPELPWREFLEKVDFYCPQVYWAKANNPAMQLEQSIRELRALEVHFGLAAKPIVPAGAAYHELGWQPTLGELDQFDAKVRELKLPGVIWWEWGHAQRYGFTETIGAHPWEVAEPPGGDPLPDPAGLAARVVSATLNLRLGPGTGYAITGSLQRGQVRLVYAVRYDAGRNEWLKVAPAKEEWIASLYGGQRLAELVYG